VTIAGFAASCGLGAACLGTIGRWSLALPASLALLAVAMSSGASKPYERDAGAASA
jgi:hypothetical protein